MDNAVLCSVVQIAVVLHFPFPYYFIWFGACVVHAQQYLHPCGYLTHTHNAQHAAHTIYTPYEYCLQVS